MHYAGNVYLQIIYTIEMHEREREHHSLCLLACTSPAVYTTPIEGDAERDALVYGCPHRGAHGMAPWYAGGRVGKSAGFDRGSLREIMNAGHSRLSDR